MGHEGIIVICLDLCKSFFKFWIMYDLYLNDVILVYDVPAIYLK